MTSQLSDPFSADRLAYLFRDFCRFAGIGITTGYSQVRSGRTLVLARDAAAWLAALPEGTEAEPEPARRGRKTRASEAHQ
jgi:hypothetical protein